MFWRTYGSECTSASAFPLAILAMTFSRMILKRSFWSSPLFTADVSILVTMLYRGVGTAALPLLVPAVAGAGAVAAPDPASSALSATPGAAPSFAALPACTPSFFDLARSFLLCRFLEYSSKVGMRGSRGAEDAPGCCSCNLCSASCAKRSSSANLASRAWMRALSSSSSCSILTPCGLASSMGTSCCPFCCCGCCCCCCCPSCTCCCSGCGCKS
mmetsp:Transcript_16675/g.43599  ORF Transcript_16675/g.43599 Transcript_16675/m.43599 type:complete len:215 (-) Transcript_16675:708-1352(-)